VLMTLCLLTFLTPLFLFMGRWKFCCYEVIFGKVLRA
jgi:hypothetical protein